MVYQTWNTDRRLYSTNYYVRRDAMETWLGMATEYVALQSGGACSLVEPSPISCDIQKQREKET